DEELMGGVTEDRARPGRYVGFVLRPETGEYLGYAAYDDLDEALAALNAVAREWRYEATSGCGGGDCASGQCGQQGTLACPKVRKKGEAPGAADCAGPGGCT